MTEIPEYDGTPDFTIESEIPDFPAQPDTLERSSFFSDALKAKAKGRVLTQIHQNYNLVAAIGVKVTNLDIIAGEIINFAILPLLPDYSPYQDLPFLEIWLRPFNELAEVKGKSLYIKARSIGIDPSMGADLVVDWFEKLGLVKGKRIVPLGYNFVRIQPMLERWLGKSTYDYIFDWRYRDVMIAAGVINDISYWRNEPYIYPKYDLGSISTRSGGRPGGNKYAIELADSIASTYKGLVSILR